METKYKNKSLKSIQTKEIVSEEKPVKVLHKVFLKNNTLVNGRILRGEVELTNEEYELVKPFI